jgi:hypothetical protein
MSVLRSIGKGFVWTGGLLAYVFFGVVVGRASVLLVSVPCLFVLAIVWLYRRGLFSKVVYCVAVLTLVLFILPFDVGFRRTGRLGIMRKPIIWGLPARASVERVRRGEAELGGCVVPVNAAKEIVIITF